MERYERVDLEQQWRCEQFFAESAVALRCMELLSGSLLLREITIEATNAEGKSMGMDPEILQMVLDEILLPFLHDALQQMYFSGLVIYSVGSLARRSMHGDAGVADWKRLNIHSPTNMLVERGWKNREEHFVVRETFEMESKHLKVFPVKSARRKRFTDGNTGFVTERWVIDPDAHRCIQWHQHADGVAANYDRADERNTSVPITLVREFGGSGGDAFAYRSSNNSSYSTIHDKTPGARVTRETEGLAEAWQQLSEAQADFMNAADISSAEYHRSALSKKEDTRGRPPPQWIAPAGTKPQTVALPGPVSNFREATDELRLQACATFGVPISYILRPTNARVDTGIDEEILQKSANRYRRQITRLLEEAFVAICPCNAKEKKKLHVTATIHDPVPSVEVWKEYAEMLPESVMRQRMADAFYFDVDEYEQGKFVIGEEEIEAGAVESEKK